MGFGGSVVAGSEGGAGWVGCEVGAIRWMGSSVHAQVCGGVYVKNMHETITR